jgi:uncharacterized protein (TIGR01777 family)
VALSCGWNTDRATLDGEPSEGRSTVRVAVTGSTGLVGSALTASLAADGHEVVRIVRRPPAGPSECFWDPANGVIEDEALGGVEGVVHLAGAGIGDRRWTPARRRELVSSRVDSTRLVARTLADMQVEPSVFVSASAIGIYGNRGDEVLTETSDLGDDFLADLCRQWEQATGPAAEAGVRTVHPRSGIVLSSKGGALGRQLPLFRLGLGGRLGSGRQWTSWVSIEDEVRALRFALEHQGVTGPMNVVAPAPVTNRDFTAALGRALRRPAAMAVPPFALRLALGRELVDVALLASQRVRPATLETAGFRFAHPDIDSALAAVLGT